MLPQGQVTAGDEKDDCVSNGAGQTRLRARRDRPAWLQTLIAVPAAVFPLLPSFSCPVCVAAYGGVLSSLGLGFVLIDRVQRPLIVAFLIVSVAGVAWATKQHGKLGPLVVVVLGSVAVVVGRVVWTNQPVLYIGIVCLLAATVWNLILKGRHARRGDPAAARSA